MSRKEERQFDVAELAASNKGTGSIIAPLVGASVGLGIAGGIATNVAKSMPNMANAIPPPLPTPGGVGMPPPEHEYMIAVGGKQYGPYKVDALAKWAKEGTIALSPETLVWRTGMTNWMRCADCTELSSIIERGTNFEVPPRCQVQLDIDDSRFC